jgi:hypothetical protein
VRQTVDDQTNRVLDDVRADVEQRARDLLLLEEVVEGPAWQEGSVVEGDLQRGKP